MRTLHASERLAAFCETYGGPLIHPLSASVPIKHPMLDAIRKDVPLIIEAQKVILKSLLATLSIEQILDLFSVPADLAPWMSILHNPGMQVPMFRVDILPDIQGKAWICEINVDSSLGGAEAAQFRRIEETSQGLIPSPTPYEHLGSLIGQLLATHECNKVCILDWSTWEKYGAFDHRWLQLTLSAVLPGIEVYYANETNILKKLDRQTLVYRTFMAQDALCNPVVTSEIFSTAGHVLCDFSGDILSSKVWLALLHNTKYRRLLTSDMQNAIDNSIPYTVAVDESNLSSLVKQKNLFYFKSASDFGGHGVLCGRTQEPQDLYNILSQHSHKGWIAQRACDVSTIAVLRPEQAGPTMHRTVLGLYQIGNHWSGVLVRSHGLADVINVASGSTIGWGYEV